MKPCAGRTELLLFQRMWSSYNRTAQNFAENLVRAAHRGGPDLGGNCGVGRSGPWGPGLGATGNQRIHSERLLFLSRKQIPANMLQLFAGTAASLQVYIR